MAKSTPSPAILAKPNVTERQDKIKKKGAEFARKFYLFY